MKKSRWSTLLQSSQSRLLRSSLKTLLPLMSTLLPLMSTLLPLLGTLLPLSLRAQDDSIHTGGPEITQLHLETRLGWEGERLDGSGVHDETGFKGQFFNLRFDGQITRGLTFSYRQRLVKPTSGTFWDATDWIHLDWQIDQRWALSAGKQVVGIGGYEYDRAPIDLYYCSEYWYNIACYQLGVSGSYQPTKNDKLLLQVCNSPLRHWAGNNTYAINLMWYGQHGWYESIWSVNALQRDKSGHWMSYIALGNRFWMGRMVHLDVDLMNRAAAHQTFLFKDFSVISELSVHPHASTRLYAQYSYDQNKSGTDADVQIVDGTQLHHIGGGVEVSPIRSYRDGLRLFASSSWYWGQNTNPDGTCQNHQLMVEAGLKFRLDILDGMKRLLAHYSKKQQTK